MHSRVLSILLGLALGLAILGPGAWGFSTTPGTDDAAGGARAFVGATTKKLLCSQAPGFTLNLPNTSGATIAACSTSAIAPSDICSNTANGIPCLDSATKLDTSVLPASVAQGTGSPTYFPVWAGTNPAATTSSLVNSGLQWAPWPSSVSPLGHLPRLTIPQIAWGYIYGWTMIGTQDSGAFGQLILNQGIGNSTGAIIDIQSGGQTASIVKYGLGDGMSNSLELDFLNQDRGLVSIGNNGQGIINTWPTQLVSINTTVPAEPPSGTKLLVDGPILASNKFNAGFAVSISGTTLTQTSTATRTVLGTATSTATSTVTSTATYTVTNTVSTTKTATYTTITTASGSGTSVYVNGGPNNVTIGVKTGTDTSAVARGDDGVTSRLSSISPQSVGTANTIGTSVNVSREDHIHNHGNQAGGTLHAIATPSVAGFESSADKTKLDGLPSSAVAANAAIAAVGKFYFVTGTGTATATTTAVTQLGNVTGMGCLP
jgi:hypothetical protein